MRFSEFKKNIDSSKKSIRDSTEKTKNLEILLEIISKVNQSIELNDVLKLVIRSAIKLTNFDKGCIYLTNPEKKHLEFRIGMDSSNIILTSSSFSPSHTVIKDVFDTGQSVFIENALNSTDCRQCKSILDLELQTIFCSPLQNAKGRIGVLYIDSKKLHDFKGQNIVEIFEIMAGQVTASIMNAQLYKDLQNLSRVYSKGILVRMQGNRNKAAEFLGISRKKLDDIVDSI